MAEIPDGMNLLLRNQGDCLPGGGASLTTG